jgi:hypothetical protein
MYPSHSSQPFLSGRPGNPFPALSLLTWSYTRSRDGATCTLDSPNLLLYHITFMFTPCLKYIHSSSSRNLFESWCIFLSSESSHYFRILGHKFCNKTFTKLPNLNRVQQNFYEVPQFEQSSFIPIIPRISQGCFRVCPQVRRAIGTVTVTGTKSEGLLK